jgi:ribosomal protein S27AE
MIEFITAFSSKSFKKGDRDNGGPDRGNKPQKK